ncbi:hypothetical protein [Hyphomicrobium sp. DY-1]|jgi:hypothetical protein|uniref:hypothetical protein n=1 Tax=Hyphomicrobium sp. DY-1 TaxID=3075650 RepID=UPI0039C115D4
MKSSLTFTTAAALRGLTGWFAGRGGETMADEDHVPFVVSACGYRQAPTPTEFSERDDRWHPGLSLDNFS